MPLFGTSGIRRLADRDLLELSLQVGMAVGTLYPWVVIGRDTRTSGNVLRHAVTAGILAAGAHVSDAGVMPTPTVGFLAREFAAGIMITASHNPPQYNGLKMLNPDGSAFSSQQQDRIEDLIKGSLPINLAWDKMQSDEPYFSGIEKHLTRILQDFPGAQKVKVVVDCGCGAAFHITPLLLSRLGCQVIPLNCHQSGIFPHDIEPIEANLGDLMQAVKHSGADLGIAHDGDADRMMAVDDRGRFISGDKLLAILAGASQLNRIVTTVDASMAIEERGYQVIRTKVGDPYVSEELKVGGGFGGEPSGAWVFPQISLCPDGIFAAAQIVAIAARSKLSELADSIPVYPVIRGNVAGLIPDMDDLRQLLADKLNPLSIDPIDGTKLVFNDGWLLIRPSGTEPKIRVTAEGKTEEAARAYFESGKSVIQAYLASNP